MEPFFLKKSALVWVSKFQHEIAILAISLSRALAPSPQTGSPETGPNRPFFMVEQFFFGDRCSVKRCGASFISSKHQLPSVSSGRNSLQKLLTKQALPFFFSSVSWIWHSECTVLLVTDLLRLVRGRGNFIAHGSGYVDNNEGLLQDSSQKESSKDCRKTQATAMSKMTRITVYT